MSYDPYQNYAQQLGPYAGITAQNNPFAALQAQPNTAALNPYAAAALGFASNIPNGGQYQGGQQGIQGLNQSGINLQQLQLAALLASQGAIPQWPGQHNQFGGGLHNPLLNPQLAAAYFSAAQQLGYQPHQAYGQQQAGQNSGQYASPYGQQQGLPSQNNPFQNNPFQNNPFQNNPFQNNFQNNPSYGQSQQYGAPLAPQSWIGQQGVFGGAQPFGQNNPFANQWAQRPLPFQGNSPWGY